jgi:hypothetical protein
MSNLKQTDMKTLNSTDSRFTTRKQVRMNCACCNKKINRNHTNFSYVGVDKSNNILGVILLDDNSIDLRDVNNSEFYQVRAMGGNCVKKFYSKNDVIKPKNASAELKVWNTDGTNFHYVIRDSKGNEMILQRGTEYLEFKIAQQEYLKKIKKSDIIIW